MHIVIEGRVYQPTAMDDVTLRDILSLEQDLRAVDLGVRTWAELRELAALFATLSDVEIEAHPSALLFLAATLWATRRAAGEKLSLLDAVDVPMAAVRFVMDPDDTPRTGPPEGKARGGSGRAGGPRPAAKKASKSR